MIMEATLDFGDLIPGTLEMLILKALDRGPQHGYGVAEWIEQTSNQVLKVEEGALYPALHRLERKGWLDSKWESRDAKREFKYYRLSAAGRKQLVAEESKWKQLVGAIARVATPIGGLE